MKKGTKRAFTVGWDSAAQNNMTDPANDYNHITEVGKRKTSYGNKDHVIMFRGKNNHAPQKDLELGKKAITHKTIAEKLSRLTCGQGVKFKIKEPANEDGDLTEFEKMLIEEAEELLEKGLKKSLKDISNGIVYHNLSNIIVTQERARFSEVREAVHPTIKHISSQPSERMRWSEPIMTENAVEITPYHYYHKNWNFTGNCEKDKRKRMPSMVDIVEYIRESSRGNRPKSAFYVHSDESPTAKRQRYVSFALTGEKGIFDGAYPIPKWKANSSINDIQNEFEASCVRTDFLRNGLHVFAVVNVYSTKFNITTENDEDSPSEEWADSLEVVKALKRSHNSGKVIVNALGTEDAAMDGKIEVEKIDIDFPSDTYKALVEQSTNGVLTAWSVNPDLFGIVKPDGSNLRSQEGFMRVGILMLKEDVTLYQSHISNGINRVLEFYGMEQVEAYIEQNESNLYLSVMADLAKEYFRINEVRTKILGVKKWNEEELAEFIEEKAKFGASEKKKTETKEAA